MNEAIVAYYATKNTADLRDTRELYDECARSTMHSQAHRDMYRRSVDAIDQVLGERAVTRLGL